MFKTAVLISLIAGAAAEHVEPEALDLEVVVEGGRRELFPLTPGVKCPAGHKCHARTQRAGVAPMMASLNEDAGGVAPLTPFLKENLKSPLVEPESWHAMNTNLNTAVKSDDYCTRRGAMARAAGLAAGMSFATVNAPAFAAATTEVKMGDDSGQLVFVPKKIKVCKGDSVKWIINKAGPHNVVFDEDNIPSGVDQEKISMDGQLQEEGADFTMSFDTAGTYGYYCEPHRSAGMQGELTVA
jgi:plastocyanin